MAGEKPTRETALALFKRYNSDPSLFKHALAVEAVMGHFAELFGEEDVEKWRVIGLIHDLDYQESPDRHCHRTKEILEEEGWPADYIRAVLSHGWKLCTEVEPREQMEKVIYTIDELTGLINATVLMRPDKSIMELNVKSVRKKFKQKNFAAAVDRDIISEGAALLGMDLDQVFAETIAGMRRAAPELGLDGSASEGPS